MLNTSCDIVVIGAGPYGLSAAAHLRSCLGLETRVFGEPMWFWKSRMPEGMVLRSAWSASHISDPRSALTLEAYRSASRNHLAAPVPLDRFIEYGLWFQRQAVPDLDQRKITTVQPNRDGFRTTLEDGEVVHSRRVVIAAGIAPFARRLAEFEGLPASLVSHTSDHRDLKRFAGKRIVVIGGGQSALECAALLHEAGAEVEVILRAPAVHWLGWKARLQKLGLVGRLLFSPTDVGPAGISRIVAAPDLMRKLPRGLQDSLRLLSIRPAGTRWLAPRLKSVAITRGRRVCSAIPSSGQLHLTLDDGSERRVDHALLGTGYRVDVSRYGFLAPELVRSLQLSNGFPMLRAGFESSVSGLHFLGAPAAWTYGPLMYFVSGTAYASRALTRYIIKQKKG